MTERYVVKCKFKTSHSVEYIDYLGYSHPITEYRPIAHFGMGKTEAEAVARAWFMNKENGTNVASVSVVRLSKWPPYPEMDVVGYYEYD